MKRKEKKNTDSKNGVKGICKPFFYKNDQSPPAI